MRDKEDRISPWQGFFLLCALWQGGYGLILCYMWAPFGRNAFGMLLANGLICALLIAFAGKGQGKLWKGIYFLLLYGYLFLALATWQEMLNCEFLIYTPRSIAVGVLMAGILYLQKSGWKTLGRLAQLSMIILLPSVLGIIFLGAENVSFFNQYFAQKISVGEYFYGIVLGFPLFMAVWMWPMIKEKSQGSNKMAYGALAVAMLMVGIEYSAVMLVFGEESKEMYWGLIELSAMVHMGAVIERLESIGICIWLVFALLHGGIVLHAIEDGWKGKGRWIVLLLLYLAVVFADDVVLLKYMAVGYGYLAVLFSVLLLVIGLWERKRE